MATTNKVKGWSGVFMTEDSSSHWPIKRRYVYSETSRRAGLEFVCIFGHDGQHTYISQLRTRDAQQIAHLRDVKSGITCKELAREVLHNVEVDRKVLREYLESKSRPVPEFLHERFDKADSDSASVWSHAD